ncbi:hypothetical protein NEPAR04_2541, partial [Nematocida parisii]
MKRVNIRTLLFLYVIGCLAGMSTLLAADAELLFKLENSDAAG